MRKMLYVLMTALLISTGVQAKSFDRRGYVQPVRGGQTIIVNNYEAGYQKTRPDFNRGKKHHVQKHDCRRTVVCHKKDKSAAKAMAVSLGLVGTVAVIAALAN